MPSLAGDLLQRRRPSPARGRGFRARTARRSAPAADRCRSAPCRRRRRGWVGIRFSNIGRTMTAAARPVNGRGGIPSPHGRIARNANRALMPLAELPRLAIAIAAVIGLAAAHARGPEQIGVVLMHGKQSAPEEHRRSRRPRSRQCRLRVDVPEMCWTARRIYDRPYGECLREIVPRRTPEAEGRDGIRGGRPQPWRERRARLRRRSTKSLKASLRSRPDTRPEVAEQARRGRASSWRLRGSCCGGSAATSRPITGLQTATSPSRNCRDGRTALSRTPRAELARARATANASAPENACR